MGSINTAQRAFCGKCGGGLVDGSCQKCVSEYKGVLVSEDEQVVHTLGTRGSKQSFLLLSDKRLYIEGKMLKTFENGKLAGIFLHKKDGTYEVEDSKKKVSELRDVVTVGVSNMTSRKAYYGSAVCGGAFLLFLILLIGSVIGYFGLMNETQNLGHLSYFERVQRANEIAKETEDLQRNITVFGVLMGVSIFGIFVSGIVTVAKSARVIKVTMNGGVNFGVDSKGVNDTELNALIQRFNTAKANVNDSTERAISEAVSQIKTAQPVTSSSEELMRYADLLDKGLITREEFDEFKAGVLKK